MDSVKERAQSADGKLIQKRSNSGRNREGHNIGSGVMKMDSTRKEIIESYLYKLD